MLKAKGKRAVLVTCGSLKEARKIAAAVVEKKLAACVNIATAPFESVYRWKGKIESAQERMLLIKTSRKRLGKLQAAVEKLHSYDVPEFIALPIVEGSTSYLAWLEQCLEKTSG